MSMNTFQASIGHIALFGDALKELLYSPCDVILRLGVG